MEDVHRLIPAFDGDARTSFVGIYDGHGGAFVCLCLAVVVVARLHACGGMVGSFVSSVNRVVNRSTG